MDIKHLETIEKPISYTTLQAQKTLQFVQAYLHALAHTPYAPL